MNLSKKTCLPCTKGTPPLQGKELEKLANELSKEWKVINEHQLEREFSFPNFQKALAFTNKIGEIAENQGHHPDIYISWGKVKVLLWTHKIKGLSENDFILAAKIDELGVL